MVESTRNKTQITDQLQKDKTKMEGEMHDGNGEKNIFCLSLFPALNTLYVTS